MRHEAACASGGIAILAAMAELEAGRYDVALVLGVEQEKSVPGDEAARILGAASWVGHEGDAEFVWPHQFSLLAEEYDRRYGLDHQHLAGIAELNYRNARSNPYAQTRTWTSVRSARMTPTRSSAAGPSYRLLADHRRWRGSGPRESGIAEEWAERHGGKSPAEIKGWGHRTVGLALQDKLDVQESTSCRTCSRPSPTRSGGPGSRTCGSSTGSRRTTASRRASTWRSTTSASPRPGRAGRRSSRGCSRRTARSR